MKNNFNDKILETAQLITNSKKTFVLTGAGMSTESGIPDFRSDTGYYQKMDPVNALSKDVLLSNPKRFYSEGYKILEDLNDKNPNEGHLALAELEDMEYISGIITQNIDNLHTKAGSKNVYEVHGETRGVHCMKCGSSFAFKVMQEKVNSGQIPPKCDKCGGTLRPNVVMFGDMMPEDFQLAVRELESTELLIVIGSSLTVAPVNYLPQYVEKLIIINSTPTLEDNNAEMVFHEQAGTVLQSILKEVKRLNDL